MKPFRFSYHTNLGYITIHWVEEPEFKIVQIDLPRPEIIGSISTEDERIVNLALRIEIAIEGRPVSFDFDIFDFDSCSEFQRKVLMAEFAIPLGKVSTYGRIAKHIGHPGAARAVGTALATNPCPLVIPCHRAVRANGHIGMYQGGVKMKRTLLQLEGVKFISDTLVDISDAHY